MALLELLRKAELEEDVDCLREGVRLMAQQLMETEVAQHVGADKLRLTRFDGHLKTGDTCPDGVRLNGEALEAPVHQRIQS